MTFRYYRLTPLGRLRAPVEPRGGVTVALELDPTRTGYQAAVAVCSPRDAFSRRIGRAIAEGRLSSQVYAVPASIADGRPDAYAVTTLAARAAGEARLFARTGHRYVLQLTGKRRGRV